MQRDIRMDIYIYFKLKTRYMFKYPKNSLDMEIIMIDISLLP